MMTGLRTVRELMGNGEIFKQWEQNRGKKSQVLHTGKLTNLKPLI